MVSVFHKFVHVAAARAKEVLPHGSHEDRYQWVVNHLEEIYLPLLLDGLADDRVDDCDVIFVCRLLAQPGFKGMIFDETNPTFNDLRHHLGLACMDDSDNEGSSPPSSPAPSSDDGIEILDLSSGSPSL